MLLEGDKMKLSQDQTKYLKIFWQFKAAYRKEYLFRSFSSDQVETLTEQLINLGVLKRAKNGAISYALKKKYSLKELIDLNSITLEDVENEITKWTNIVEEGKKELNKNTCVFSRRDLINSLESSKNTLAHYQSVKKQMVG